MAVPMASSATGVTFGGFTCRAASFRVAGVMKCHSDVFRNVRVFGGSCYTPLLFKGFQAGCHVVLRGTRGTW